MLEMSRRRAFSLGGIAIASIVAACSSFSSSDDGDAGSGPAELDAALDGNVDAGEPKSHCAEGRRATLLASGQARALASDDRGAYWTDAVDSGAFLTIATPDAGARFPANSPEVAFIQPQVATVAFIQHNPDDFCWLREYNRGSAALPSPTVGTNCRAAFFTGDISGGVAVAKLDAYATQFTLQRLAPSAASLKLEQPGKPMSMVSDGVWIYVVFGDTSGYSAIWRYSFSDPPQNLTQDAGARGPIALWKDQLVWLTSAGAVRSMSTSGGAITEHGTVAGAKMIAVGGDCVYLATGDAVVSVDPVAGWTASPIDTALAIELSAGRSGVFWTTSTGGVEALWR